MTLHFRQRRISECIQRYVPAEIAGGKHSVRDAETGQLVPGTFYDTATLALVQCRMLAAADIEALYLPAEATALARVATIIAEQSDPQWAARLIYEFFAGSKA